jgi:uncharacterized protein involved in exopolysaccharide biosynthesis
MRRALYALILLYPKSWRNRYKNEFNALLDDVPPTWRTFFDVLRGALKMQMTNWNAWKFVAGFAIAGALGATAVALTMTNRYVSHAIVGTGGASEEQLATQVKQVVSRSNLTALINEEGLYKDERTRLPLEDVIQQMKQKDILIAHVKSMTGGPSAISISFAAADPALAQRATRYLTSQFLDAKVYTLLDPANLPIHAASPKRPMITGAGLAAGLIAGLLFAFLRKPAAVLKA